MAVLSYPKCGILKQGVPKDPARRDPYALPPGGRKLIVEVEK